MPCNIIENYHIFKENFAKKKDLKVLFRKLETETSILWKLCIMSLVDVFVQVVEKEPCSLKCS